MLGSLHSNSQDHTLGFHRGTKVQTFQHMIDSGSDKTLNIQHDRFTRYYALLVTKRNSGEYLKEEREQYEDIEITT